LPNTAQVRPILQAICLIVIMTQILIQDYLLNGVFYYGYIFADDQVRPILCFVGIDL